VHQAFIKGRSRLAQLRAARRDGGFATQNADIELSSKSGDNSLGEPFLSTTKSMDATDNEVL
jgi:hypothetical protein